MPLELEPADVVDQLTAIATIARGPIERRLTAPDPATPNHRQHA